MKYRKKPVVIEAFQFDGPLKASQFPQWFWDACESKVVEAFKDYCLIKTLEGTITAKIGDWIIQEIAGELYPCKPEIFSKIYEVAE